MTPAVFLNEPWLSQLIDRLPFQRQSLNFFWIGEICLFLNVDPGYLALPVIELHEQQHNGHHLLIFFWPILLLFVQESRPPFSGCKAPTVAKTSFTITFSINSCSKKNVYNTTSILIIDLPCIENVHMTNDCY